MTGNTWNLLSLWIHIPSEEVIGDYLCRLGGSNCLLRRYVDPKGITVETRPSPYLRYGTIPDPGFGDNPRNGGTKSDVIGCDGHDGHDDVLGCQTTRTRR